MSEDDLRGSTPIYTAKDVLVQLDGRVQQMDLKLDGALTAIQILVSQNLNERVVQLEAERSRMQGMSMAVKALFGSSAVASVAALVAILKAFGALQ